MSEISASVVSANQPGESVQPDPVSGFSFGNLHEQALNMMEGGTPQEQPAQPAVGAQQQEVTEETPQNVDGATAAQIAQLKDDDLVEVTVDGEPLQMAWKDARAGVMRQAKFTKEMQTLRREQSSFETERQTLSQAREEREALVTLLKNEDLMKAFLSKQYPHLLSQAKQAAEQAASQPQLDPDDIASVGQVDQIARAYAENVAHLVAELKQELQQEVSRVTETIEDRQATAKLMGEISTTINALFEEHPYIQKVIPDAEQILRYQVLQLQPQTPQETLEAFKQVYAGWVENYKAAVAETTKSTVLAKQKLVQNNIQPPGGAAVTPQPTSFKKPDGKVDWDKLREAALNMMG